MTSAMIKFLSDAQVAVLGDIRRMSRAQGFVPASQLQHLDGRTIVSLERRGFIQYRDARYYPVTI